MRPSGTFPKMTTLSWTVLATCWGHRTLPTTFTLCRACPESCLEPSQSPAHTQSHPKAAPEPYIGWEPIAFQLTKWKCPSVVKLFLHSSDVDVHLSSKKRPDAATWRWGDCNRWSGVGNKLCSRWSSLRRRSDPNCNVWVLWHRCLWYTLMCLKMTITWNHMLNHW